MDMAEKFAYLNRLEAAEIRLLRVQPGGDDEILRCDLSVHNVADVRGRYSALSYCWGSTTLTEHIVCNHAGLAITSSLYIALRQHRALGNTSPLWADAICINQEDIEEKNAQVRQMKRIYEQAEKVIIWIGEKRDDDVPGLELCKQMAAHRENIEARIDAEIRSGVALLDRPHANLPIEPPKGLPPFEDHSWTSMFLLISRPWFFRVWIIQEFLVNEKLTLRCGDVELSFQSLLKEFHALDFAKAASWIRDQAAIARRTYEDCRDRDLGAPTILALGAMKRMRQDGYDSILGYLLASRLFEATDPRDKMFSLIGLTPAIDIELIDYSHSLRFVVLILARKIIENLPEIDNYSITSPVEFIAWAHVFRTEWSKSNIPSWAPNFSTPKTSGYTIASWFRSSSSQTVVDASKLGSNVWLIDQGEDPDGHELATVLRTSAIRFDVIEQTTDLPLVALVLGDDPLPRDKFFEREEKHLRDTLDLIQGLFPHLSLDEIEESLWRTLLCNHNFHRSLTVDDWPAFQATLEWLRTADDLDYAKSQTIAPFLSPLGEIGAFRLLFVTRGGRLGIGPVEAKSGDQVHFFLGSQFPLLLRQQSTQFELVGDCYLHGVMEGDAHKDFSKFTEIEIV